MNSPDQPELDEQVVLHRIRVSYEASAAGPTGAQVLESILADLGWEFVISF